MNVFDFGRAQIIFCLEWIGVQIGLHRTRKWTEYVWIPAYTYVIQWFPLR